MCPGVFDNSGSFKSLRVGGGGGYGTPFLLYTVVNAYSLSAANDYR